MQTGDRVGRYVLEQKLGEGAMALVFAARHPQLEPAVAIKMLRREVTSDRQYADRFLEDARAAATLNHPNIVGVRDYDVADGMPFIVMEWVDGSTLERLLVERRLEVAEAARIARDIALALGAAHAAGIIHRDVKPSNALIERKSGKAKLTDFGAAKRERPGAQLLTAHGQTIGTPRYMAPEQINGEPVDARTDLWALGATLYEMLAGRPAFQATSLAKLYLCILQEPPQSLSELRPGLPLELTNLVERLLAKVSSDRPDSATEVARILVPFTDPDASVLMTEPRAGGRRSPPPRATASVPGVGRRWIVLTAAAALALVPVTSFVVHSMGHPPAVAAARLDPSIAVLPFLNASGDAHVDRLAFGLTRDLITDLARFRDLDVIALDSTEGYTDAARNARRLGQNLNARYVLDGSLQQQGDHVRVTAQLLDTASGAHLWGDRWDRPTSDLFAVQSEVAEAVAGQLGGSNGTINTANRSLVKRKEPHNLDAYELYLLGLADLHAGGKTDIEAAIGAFERSIAIEPDLARAWSSLSEAYLKLRGHVEDGRGLILKAVEAARRAVALDSRDGEAAAALATALGEQGDLTGSEEMFARALELNPSSADILNGYASWASTFGKPGAGVQAARRALHLNPNMAPTAIARQRYAFFMTGSYDEALRLNAQIPDTAYGRDDYVYRAVLLSETGKANDARAAVADALRRFPSISVEGWAGQAGYSEPERQRWIQTMLAAGFPLCASEQTLVDRSVMRRLPECEIKSAM